MTDSHLVVDGSNIATEGRTSPSLAQLDEAVQAFTLEYSFDNVVVVVDATFAHRIDPAERDIYEEAVLAGELLTPPAGAIGRGDAFVLEIANRCDGAVLSNDSFQEFHADHEWLFDDGRLWGGKPVPGVGWVFVARLPVRGPLSFKAKRSASSTKRAKQDEDKPSKPPTKQSKKKSATASNIAKAAKPSKSESDSRTKKATRSGNDKPPKSTDTAEAGRARQQGTRSTASTMINSPAAFLDFVTTHPVGALVEGAVVEFASHGAYVEVGSTRCYVSLKSMGDPPPRSPRELLGIGETRPFIVQGFDTPRRGVDLALPGSSGVGTTADDDSVSSSPVDPTDTESESATQPFLTQEPPEEASVVASSKSAAKKKAAAKKPTAAAKKTTAKKAAPAKKTASAKKAAPAKKTAVKKTATAKPPAKKTAAKKTAPARKATAKKAAPAKKAPAAKAPAKKAPAAKAPAKKAPAAKAPAKKAPAKKAAAAKAPAKKAPAKKTPAKKAAPAKKTAAKRK